MKHLTYRNLCLLTTLTFSISSHAQTTDDTLEEIVVTSHPLAQNGSAQSITVLSGDELAEKLQGSIGAVVAREPGVQSASYGTGVGRPVIRGLGTTRIKTTQDSIDTLDVSVTSGDHPVAVEPFIADQIEILRGPSALLYGAGATGGVVNVETGRIARSVSNEDFSGRVELRSADNGNATTAAVRFDGKFSDALHWHIDGFDRSADEFDIPEFGETNALIADGEQVSTTFGILENSQSDSQGGALGLSWVEDAGFAGFSVSAIESEFGLFGEPDILPFIALEQVRYDIEAQLNNPFTGIESINFRVGVNDYEHAEIALDEESTEDPLTFVPVTVFENDALEARLLAKHAPIANFSGTLGLQFGDRDFEAVGAEAFIQPTQVDTLGLFWVGERSFRTFDLELGIRFDQVDYESSVPILGDLDNQVEIDRSFDTNSASAGLIFPISDTLTISGLVDYSTRAPSIEELLSFGPHIATRSFEVGDTELEEEEAINFSLSANYQSSWFNVTANLYQTLFDGFIYEVSTGQSDIDSALTTTDFDLPVFIFLQEDATVTGFDITADFALGQLGGGDLKFSALFDTVDAELDDAPIIGNQNLPRIPASRFGIGFDWRSDLWTASIDYLRVDDQDETTEFERPTDSYDDISIFINRKLGELDLFFHGRNLSDDDQRNHTSIVKDIGPAQGRSFEIGARFQF